MIATTQNCKHSPLYQRLYISGSNVLLIIILIARIPQGISNHDTKLIQIRRKVLRTLKLPLNITNHQVEMIVVTRLNNARFGRQRILKVKSQLARARMARLLRKPCKESRTGDSGIQGGFVVAAAEPAVPVDLDADYNLSGRMAVVGFGAVKSRNLGWLLL